MFVIRSHGTGFIMSHQLTFADSEFSSKRRQTRKEIFCPAWSRFCHGRTWWQSSSRFTPRLVMAGDLSAETMRIHCMQHWYNLSDGAMEDALYEIASMRLFAHYPWIAPCRIAPPS
jgi:IS5 family transposase